MRSRLGRSPVAAGATALAVVNAGMTMLVVMGGINVGVGGSLAVSAIVIGRAYQAGLPDLQVAPLGLGADALQGALNGILCGRLRVPPIIATLGTMYVWLAILFLVIGGNWITGLPGTLSPLVKGLLLGIPSAPRHPRRLRGLRAAARARSREVRRAFPTPPAAAGPVRARAVTLPRDTVA